jgi:hypothetical protein
MTDQLRRITAITIATEAAMSRARSPDISDEEIAQAWRKYFFEALQQPSGGILGPALSKPPGTVDEKTAVTLDSDSTDDQQGGGEKG